VRGGDKEEAAPASWSEDLYHAHSAAAGGTGRWIECGVGRVRFETLERGLLFGYEFRPGRCALAEQLACPGELLLAVTVGDAPEKIRDRSLGSFHLFRNVSIVLASEYTTGERRRQGRVTKCGNVHVRRVLCEAAWAYDNPPAISRHLLKRQENLPKEIRDVAWKAQLRLCARFRHLTAMRKQRDKVNTSVARELCGFVWKIATLVPLGTMQSYRLQKSPRRRAPGRRRIRVVAPAA
jgi:hypothetical protein